MKKKKTKILRQFATTPPVNHLLSELSTMIHPSWVALYGMVHCYNELHKAVIHVIILVLS